MPHTPDIIEAFRETLPPGFAPPPPDNSDIIEAFRQTIQQDLAELSLPVRLDPPLIDSQGQSFFTQTEPLALQQSRQQQQEKESGLMKTLKFLGEVTGIPAIVRSAISLLPERVEDTAREGLKEAFGIEVREAGLGDYAVAGITLLGGFGIKGALTLIGKVSRGALKPFLEASPSAVRKGIKLAVGEVPGGEAAAIATGAREVGEFALPFSQAEAQHAFRTAVQLQRSGVDILDDPAIKELNERLFKKIGLAYEQGKVDIEILPRIMRDIGADDTAEGMAVFARLLEGAARESGRTLGLLSAFKKELGRVFKTSVDVDKELGEIFVEQGISRILSVGGLTSFWRSSITAQLGTSIRNVEVSAGLLTPIRVFDDVYTGAVAKFTGATGVPASAKAATETFLGLFRTLFGGVSVGKRVFRKGQGVLFASKRAEQLERQLQSVDFTEAARLFGSPVMDMAEVGIKGIGGKVINFLQLFNRTQEFPARSIIFDATFGKRMSVLGIKPVDFWKQGLKAFPGKEKVILEALSDSISEALYLTFAKGPQGTLGKWLISSYRQFPALALVHPFPRFLANSLKFMNDHSPLGVARFMTQGQQRAIVKGLVKTTGNLEAAVSREAATAIGKTMTGYTLFAGAMALRNSDMAGDRWYEIKAGGKVIDARPFNPLAAFLLLGEAMRRLAEPEKAGPPLKVKDYADAFAGVRRLQGTGLFIFHAFDSDVESFTKGLQRTAAEIVGGFTVPARTFKDFLALTKQDEGVFRARDVGGILGPALGNLPLLSTALPEVPRPTRPGVLGDDSTPAVRQLTGISARDRTPVESALINLNINASPRTGDPEIDRLISAKMGPEVDKRLNRLVESSAFKRLDSVDQKTKLSKELGKIRTKARHRVLREERPRIVRELIEEFRGVPRVEAKRELQRRQRAGSIDESIARAVLSRL